MQGVDNSTAEEFYSRLQLNADVLHQSSVNFADNADIVPAVACAMGADLATMESVVWEKLNIAPRSPQRQFFQAVAAVSGSLEDFSEVVPEEGGSAPSFLLALRRRTVADFDETLAAEVANRWPSLSHLEGFPLPSGHEILTRRDELLEGLTPAEFVKARRASSGQAMLTAQSHRVRSASTEAVQAAYESDFLAMEAYLVESAVAVGDVPLFTVFTRRELVWQALAELSELPGDFNEAVAGIRLAMATGLGEADGERLRSALIDLP